MKRGPSTISSRIKYKEPLELGPETKPLHHARPLEYALSRFRGGAVQILDKMTLSAGMHATTLIAMYDIHEGMAAVHSQ